jgi:hypothetical protein
VAVHRIGEGALEDVPDLSGGGSTLISELAETETMWVPSGWMANWLTASWWAS